MQLINAKLEQVHSFIEHNKIFKLASIEAKKSEKKLKENKWKIPDKRELTIEKWEYLGNVWYLADNTTEYLYLVEMDYLEMMKLVALKMLSEYQGAAPKN